MFEIKGEKCTAICYATVCDESAIEQIRRMCDYEFTEGSKIRIMPDVHYGRGCTIGTTMTITDKVVPNIVGVDIGCGMYTVDLGKEPINLEKFDNAAHYIPSGRNIWDSRQERFDLTELRCFGELNDSRKIERSIGTLGGGNHFIEIDQSSDGTNFLVIHSGSRNLGKQVAEYYQNLAIEINRNYIESDIPDDICWLYGTYLEDYMHDVQICQQFAKRNREKIAEVLLKRTGLSAGESFHTIHNYIDTNEKILRKGAIAAHEGEKVLIPINMRDGSVLATGKGNPEWNYSAPHGAGRIMSRKEAKQELTLEEYQDAMKGIYTTTVNNRTIDEAPMAYKSLEDIIDVIHESVDVIEVLKPIYNFKASDR